MTGRSFLLVVITAPGHWPGEVECLEELLKAGLEKLHIRKLGMAEEGGSKPGTDTESLLERLAPQWSSRLVLHGGRDVIELAKRYGIPQVHGHWHKPWEEGGIKLSASLHSWEEVREVPQGGLEYVFLSPLFDSISKPGYKAGRGLLERPEGVAPCGLIGLGGIDQQTIGRVIRHGWDGAAVLGYIWESPAEALERYLLLREIIAQNGR
jgi:thiamine monophosphate synthase